MLHSSILHTELLSHPEIIKQECIPVGCVLPARYRTGGLLDRDRPWTETPLERLPLDRDPPLGQRPPHRQRPRSPPVDRQTPVKT